MDYVKLAKQFLQNSLELNKRGHQKAIGKSMEGERFVLFYVFHHGGTVLPSDISNEMGISTARVAVILNKLEDKHLILRTIDLSDRRRILVELTDKGKETAQVQSQMVIDMIVHMLKLLGSQDASDLVRIIGKLAKLAPDIINYDKSDQ